MEWEIQQKEAKQHENTVGSVDRVSDIPAVPAGGNVPDSMDEVTRTR